MDNGFKLDRQGGAPIDLEACLVQVEASKAWFTRRVLPLSIEQLRWRPDPRRWSIAECLDHLNLAFRLWLPRVNAAASTGRRQGLALIGPPRYDDSEIEALKRVEPPVAARTIAPSELIPAAAVDPEQLVDSFYESRDRYAEVVRRAFGLDIARILIVEPIAPPIHSLGGTLAFLAAHDRRHMWQSEQVRNAPRFPRGVFCYGGEDPTGSMVGENSNNGF